MCGKQNCVVNTDWISRISLWTAWRQKQSKQKDTNKFMPVFIIEVQIQLSCDFCYFGQFVNGGFLELFCFQSNFVKLIINQDCLPVCLSWYNANMLNIRSYSKSLKKEENTSTKEALSFALECFWNAHNFWMERCIEHRSAACQNNHKYILKSEIDVACTNDITRFDLITKNEKQPETTK